MAHPHRFPFAFASHYRWPARLLGIHDGSADVVVEDDHLIARFGPWRVTTPVGNISGVGLSGPFALAKTIGPPHLSFSDRGLTFATNADVGVCLSFTEPVPGMDPLGVLRHPGLTVTVADPDGLVEVLRRLDVQRTDRDWVAEQQAASDDLHTMTASGLRSLARERGVDHSARASKAELVAILEGDLGTRLPDEIS